MPTTGMRPMMPEASRSINRAADTRRIYPLNPRYPCRMAVRPILIVGDPTLHSPAQPVTDFGQELTTLITDLEETMAAAPGVGLAAPAGGRAAARLRVELARRGRHGPARNRRESGTLDHPGAGRRGR